jgi:outer membrane protein OmpA-like peptidoglycan-associated protein
MTTKLNELINSLEDPNGLLMKKTELMKDKQIESTETEDKEVLIQPKEENILFNKNIALVFIMMLFAICNNSMAQSEEVQYTRPSWYFGVAAGANGNLYGGSTQHLNADFAPPVPFHKGTGIGLYVAPHVSYHKPNTMFGAMLEVGYDSRKGKFDKVVSPCNCPADMKTDLTYISAEPSLRIAPFKSNLYFYVGPRFAYNYAKAFTYKLGTNPDYPEQPENPEVKGDFSDTKPLIISGQVGAGYDIFLSSTARKNQYVVSPFISYQPYFGQEPRTIDTWTVTTLRVGAVIKFGRGKKIDAIVKVPNVAPTMKFKVNSPKNVPSDRRIRETVPLRNYVFFDLGSTEISDRYVKLQKSEVANFRKTKLEITKEKRVKSNTKQDLSIYYNILNILGDRMLEYPNTKITLVGSSEKGEADAKVMAGSIKSYLENIFGIASSRIAIEGRDKPKIPSEQPGGTRELDLLRQGDRRVTIESTSPELLEEFQTGPNASLKGVERTIVQEAPIDSYITFDTKDLNNDFESWTVEVKDSKGVIQYFGPNTKDKIAIPGKTILGTKSEGDYKVTILGKLKDGGEIREDTTVRMVLWKPAVTDEGSRFSVIYEFNEAKTIAIYEKYLTEVVAAKIPKNATVILHGHTDTIGEEAYNAKLSTQRANDVKRILENSLAKSGRKDVKFEVVGFGEDNDLSPYDNNYPEERFYNRTVVIDIIPAK